jgi:hypothetical protein
MTLMLVFGCGIYGRFEETSDTAGQPPSSGISTHSPAREYGGCHT